MIASLTIRIRVDWLPSGQLFFRILSNRTLSDLDLERLAFHLFTWDSWSFYGTTVEVGEWNGQRGLVLSARHGLHYFAEQFFNSELQVMFEPDWSVLHQTAVGILDTLRAGCFMPDFAAWQTGELKWKAVATDPSPDVLPAGVMTSGTVSGASNVSVVFPEGVASFAADWLHHAIVETLSTTPEIAEVWDAVRRAYPLIDSPIPESSLFEDESEWLMALDLRPDPTPFYVGLALVEPNRARNKATVEGTDGWGNESGWRLQVILQDKQEAARVVPWMAQSSRATQRSVKRTTRRDDSGQKTLVLPLDWLPYLNAVDQALRRWRRLVPWLVEEVVAVNADGDTLTGNGDFPVGEVAGRNRDLDGTGLSLKLELTEGQAWEFLSNASVRLLAAGERVYLPDWWEEARRLRARLKAKVKSSVGTTQQSLFGVNQIVQFDWAAAVGDMDLTPEEFAQLLNDRRQLVELHGRWVALDPQFYERALKKMKQVAKSGGLSLRDVLTMHLLSGDGQTGERGASSTSSVNSSGVNGADAQGADVMVESGADALDGEPGMVSEANFNLPVEVELNPVLADLMDRLQNVKRLEIQPETAEFHGQLRPYQRVGASWLIFLRRFGLGACLADDMGLGKTVQFIAYLLQARKEREMLAGDLRDHQGDSVSLEGDFGTPHTILSARNISQGRALLICPTSVIGNWEKELARFAPDLQVYIHYGSNRKRDGDFRQQAATVDLVVTTYALANLDEVHLGGVVWESICLDEAQNIKNAYTKQASAIRRLKSRHRIAMTGTPVENRLTELWSIFDFLNPGYLGSLNHFRSQFVNPLERTGDMEITQALQRLVQPFLLRREKRDPAVELDLPEKSESKVFVPLTAEQAALYEATVQKMLQDLDSLSVMERRGAILTTLLKLKQICNHPAVFLKEEGGDGLGHAVSRPTKSLISRSEKLERLLEMVSELRSDGDRCLIFTQFVQTGHLLQRVLAHEFGEEVLFLHGGVSQSQREDLISRFQVAGEGSANPSSPGIFILSLKAGGVGLNLTAANHVFHFDRWWNPAVENQATDRAYRIGQQRHVQVFKFVTLGTLEERIDEMLETKQSLSHQVMGSGENWITEMSTEDLRSVFALRREWVED